MQNKNYICRVNHQWEADFLNNWAKDRNWGEQTAWKVAEGYKLFFVGIVSGPRYGVIGEGSELAKNSSFITFAEMVVYLENNQPKPQKMQINPQLSVEVDKEKIVLCFGADGDFCHKIDNCLFQKIVNFWWENKS